MIRVLEGDEVIPTSILSGDDLLSLPGSDAWTPSSTIVDTLQDIVDMVLHASEAGLPTGHGGDDAGVSSFRLLCTSSIQRTSCRMDTFDKQNRLCFEGTFSFQNEPSRRSKGVVRPLVSQS